MDNEIRTWLFDILNAIHEIDRFFANQSKIFESYCADIRTKRAVERNLEIRGEAMSHILKNNEHIVILNSRNIVDLRNRIIHGYDSVSDQMIGGGGITFLPILPTRG